MKMKLVTLSFFIYTSLFLISINQVLSVKTTKSLSQNRNTQAQIITNEASKPSNPSTMTEQKEIINPYEGMHQGWFSIQSQHFGNPTKFPALTLPNGETAKFKLNVENYLINSFYSPKKKDQNNPSTDKLFYFYQNNNLIYFSPSITEKTILASFTVKEIILNKLNEGNNYCFVLDDTSSQRYTLCATNLKDKLMFLCSLYTYFKFPLLGECANPSAVQQNQEAQIVIEQDEVEKIVLLPTPSRQCNENWNYKNKGASWECICAEGVEQSPIELPPFQEAIESRIAPLFQFTVLKGHKVETDINNKNTGEYKIKIFNENHALRIKATGFAKIVTMDGAVYMAEEIVFHTPAEHYIKGSPRPEMEMEIIYYGKSKGDINKQTVLSFLFKKTPGAYNKFFDSIDFYNLPNPLTKSEDLIGDIFIPNIQYKPDETENVILKPFSFYTYQGSLSAPPCTERTIRYVASDAIPLSSFIIEQFTEALRIPDIRGVDSTGKDSNSDLPTIFLGTKEKLENYREPQPLNGRTVFFWDATKYCNLPQPEKKIQEGHFEKIPTLSTEYYYVNSNKPSGLPGAYVIDEVEAKGLSPEVLKNQKKLK